jgi:Na+/H+ antiporter NhaD/arsenite permease-like protein
MSNAIPPLVLCACLALIFFRAKFGNVAPWIAMAFGAIAVLVLGQISIYDALIAIDWGVMAFLYGMFVLANGIERSGYLQHVGVKVLRHFKNPFHLLLAFILSIGAASALLLNDTIAIIGTLLAIAVAKNSKISAAPLLVGVALAVTIGSIASPIGNPQNYLIASQSTFANPFLSFTAYLLVPTILSLVALAAILWALFPALKNLSPLIKDTRVKDGPYHAARTALFVVVAFALLRIASAFSTLVPQFELYWIAVAGGITYLVLSQRLGDALAVDWETLAFFAGMFVLMDAVWLSGFFQPFLPVSSELSNPAIILSSSVLLSQVVSNVPFVVLYLKALGSASEATLVLLAAGSTLAGCLTIFGAASNIIVLQTAEKKGETLPMREFAYAGIASLATSIFFIMAWVSLLGAITAS